MGNLDFLFGGSETKREEPKRKKRYNNFIHYLQLKKVFEKIKNDYGVDFYTICKIYGYLITCKDRFSPKHTWDKCRLQGKTISIRTKRYRCVYRRDLHWSFPCNLSENTSKDISRDTYIGDSRWCPCKRLHETERELLIMENLLELDQNYMIL